LTSNNSPQKIVSRLLHDSDYFETLSNYSLGDFIPKLENHIEKCQHPKCISFKNVGLDLSKQRGFRLK
jgi:hypothetical protein